MRLFGRHPSLPQVSVLLMILLVPALATCQSKRKVTPLGKLPSPPAGPSGTSSRFIGEGSASFYGEELRGELMANGEPFNPDALTAASWFHPLGTRILVVHRDRSVVVTITDRGPAKRLVREGRIIDLSEASFKRLADTRRGLIPVRLYHP